VLGTSESQVSHDRGVGVLLFSTWT
jgi:hypothetical protein